MWVVRDALPNQRYNFLILTLDGLLFWLGISYFSPTTILPLYVSYLTPSNVVVGAVPAMVALAWSLPQLLGAHVLRSLTAPGSRRSLWGSTRKSYIVRTALVGRIPLLILVVATALFSVSHPTPTLVFFFLCYGAFRFTGGINTPVYYDLVAVVIHPRTRARFIGLSQFLGGAIAAVALALGRTVLDSFPFPVGFVICFGIGLFFVTVAIGCMAVVREPPIVQAPAPAETGREVLAREGIVQTIRRTLRSDSAFRSYLGGRAFVALATMAQAFYAVHAVRNLGASDGDVAGYSAVLLGCQTVSTLLWGAVADRLSLPPVLLAGTLLGALATGAALVAPSLAWFTLVFAASGASLGALAITDAGVPLALAERSGNDRALYIAVANTVFAPVYVLAPLLGGAAADAGGYPLTYLIALGAGAVAAVLVGRVAVSRGLATA